MDQNKFLETKSPVIPFSQKLQASSLSPLRSLEISVLQINVGRRCNLSCIHCHVNAGPQRAELISKTTLKQCLAIAGDSRISTIDITGGSPEMNPCLEWFIEKAALLKKRLIVRSNLAILLEPAYSPFIDVYTRNKVEIIASLPCFLMKNTNRQRGTGTYDKIISVLQSLNAVGYGIDGSGLVLSLAHNPVDANLPSSQHLLEQEYKTRLLSDHGIRFNTLYCIVNNPVGRFLEYLLASGDFDAYMQLLADSFNPGAVQNVMCRTMLSVGWDGSLYDCDFNQMLKLPVNRGAPGHISNVQAETLSAREIMVNNHCYACTAGKGSSCQGEAANLA
jgi:radical SAM/Cys-rich protein